MINNTEQTVLGAMLVDPHAADKVVDVITADDFIEVDHQMIFDKIVSLQNNNQPADVVTVAEALTGSVDFNVVTGLAGMAMGSSNVVAYAKILREKSLLRNLVSVNSEIAEVCSASMPISEKLDKAQSLIMSVGSNERDTAMGPKVIKDYLPKVIDTLDERFRNGNKITGLPTGYTRFDEMTSGLHHSNLIILAGRPSMGKTTLAMNIAEHVVLEQKQAVVVFSMEMSAEELSERCLASIGKIGLQKIRTADLGDEDWSKLTVATGKLADSKLIIDDTPALNILELRARARRLKRKHDIKLVVVDYLQLMKADGENQTQRIGEISAGLKALAKELKIPVIALSQLNRSLEQRPNKRPLNSDLRDSGNIEQDADLICFLYRDEVYNPDSPSAGMAELIISKHRNGELGMVPLTFLGATVRFENFIGDIPYASMRETKPPRRNIK